MQHVEWARGLSHQLEISSDLLLGKALHHDLWLAGIGNTKLPLYAQQMGHACVQQDEQDEACEERCGNCGCYI